MSWFVDYRLAWIAEIIDIFGYINREHLARKFRISIAQASLDLNEFQRRHPGAIEYDATAKRFVPAGRQTPPSDPGSIN